MTQARKFDARLATPYRAVSLEPRSGRHLVRLEDDREVVARAVLIATGAQYRRLPVDDLDQYIAAMMTLGSAIIWSKIAL